jgi:glycosyltransferase involved in cell wall biosynthesis
VTSRGGALSSQLSAKSVSQRTLVLIPAFNEQDNIGRVIEQVRHVDSELEILVIDDGSKDRTAYVARVANAIVVTLCSHMGYGIALQTGYKYAFENGYDYVVQLDGDGQHDPSYIPKLLEVVMSGGTDLVLGSRFLEKKLSENTRSQQHAPGIIRRIGIFVFSRVTTLLVGFRITDPTSGYQALNRRIISFFIRDLFPCDYPDADIILIAHRAGFKITEVPMIIYARDNGASMHRGLKPAYYTFKMFLSICMTMLRRKPPFLRKEEAFQKRFFERQQDVENRDERS